MNVVATTTVLCERCGESHPATIERLGNEIAGRVSCPRGERVTVLSTDAAVWLALRQKSRAFQLPEHPHRPRLLNMLPLTQHCNFHCPVCYNDSGPQPEPSFLPVAEAVRRMEQARRVGARSVSLTGGEATLHPEIVAIIRRARSLGLRVFMISNGLRIARETGLARALRRAGLSRISLQFDTLDAQTHRAIRGNDFVPEKKEAARRIVAAGLRLGLVATVTRRNLAEVGNIIAFGLPLVPALNTITFQAAAQTGRFLLSPETLVDKEQILSQVLTGYSLDDVWPLPHFEPWGLRLSPDCGVNLILAVGPRGIEPLGRFVDVAELQGRLHRVSARASRNWTPLRHLFAAARRGRRLGLVRHLAGAVVGRGRYGLVVIGVGGFCCRGFLDEQRLAGCATNELTAAGGVSPCRLYAGART